jgi:hypothetical protein
LNKKLFLTKVDQKLKFYRQNRDCNLEEFYKKQREKMSKSGNKIRGAKNTEKVLNIPTLLKTSSSGFFNVTSRSNVTKINFSSMDRTSSTGFGLPSAGSQGMNRNASISSFNYNQQDLSENSDYKNLLSYCERGHSLGKYKSTLDEFTKIEKKNTYKKFNINNLVSEDEKEIIENNFNIKSNHFRNSLTGSIGHPNSKSLVNLVIENQMYKNPINSCKKLKVNKQLFCNVMDLVNSERFKKYEEVYNKVNSL